MALRLLVDAEKLVIDFLLRQNEIKELVDVRVGSRIPANPTYPLLVATRIGGAQVVENHLDRARLQLDAWGNGKSEKKAEAGNLARTVQAACHQRMIGEHELGVITKVETSLGPIWQPDPLTERARYVLEIVVEAHPSIDSPTT